LIGQSLNQGTPTKLLNFGSIGEANEIRQLADKATLANRRGFLICIGLECYNKCMNLKKVLRKRNDLAKKLKVPDKDKPGALLDKANSKKKVATLGLI
jgi:hypothetical protein